MKRIRKRLTYANVMSSIAVFLVIGGATAFAALGKNTVGTKQLKKNAVTSAKIKNGAATTSKLANGAVTNEKLADNAVSTSKVANDAVTGAKVNESTLGQVPNAATADGPIAFAHVSSNGSLLDARGVSLVAGSDENFYCFTGLSFQPRGIQATADYWNGTPRFNTMVQAGLASSGGIGGTGCPSETQAFAHGTQADNDALSKAGIYVIFYK